MKDENFTSATQEKIRKGNFKQLYNMKYGEIAKMSQTHQVTPEQVFNLAVKYFAWAEENAVKACETASFQGIVTENLVHKARVFTINGLQLYCGFSSGVIHKWRSDPGFKDVMEYVDMVIREQKYQLAVNGIINPALISKELGLDKPTEINVSASSAVITTDEFKDAVNDILGEL